MPPSDIIEALAARIARLEQLHDNDTARQQIAALGAHMDALTGVVSRLEQRLWLAVAGAGGLGGLAGYGAQLASGGGAP